METRNEALETELAKVRPGETLEATIKWHDSGEVETVTIAMRASDEEDDDDDDEIFFYCETVDELRGLTAEDNGEDFTLLAFAGAEAKYGAMYRPGDTVTAVLTYSGETARLSIRTPVGVFLPARNPGDFPGGPTFFT